MVLCFTKHSFSIIQTQAYVFCTFTSNPKLFLPNKDSILMQIKSTVRDHLSPVRMAKIKTTTTTIKNKHNKTLYIIHRKKKLRKTIKSGSKTVCLGTSEFKEQHSGEPSGFPQLHPIYPRESTSLCPIYPRESPSTLNCPQVQEKTNK